MKKLFKIAVNAVAAALMILAAFTFTACRDIKTVEVKLSVYNYTDDKFEEKTLTVDLYRHLAPKTVDNVLAAINDGYYNGTVIYQNSSASSQLMLGEFKVNGEEIVKQADRPIVEGEFSANGLNGSNLVNKKGYVGLWRSFTVDAGAYTKTDAGMDSGTAVWYMPTTTLSSYDGYFAVFAKIDTDNTANSSAFAAIQEIFTDTHYENYEVFYTGESADALTVHVIKTDDLSSDDNYDATEGTYGGVKIYSATGADLVSLNRRTVRIPVSENGNRVVTVTGINIK